MRTRTIGSLEVSVIGLGTNNFGLLMEEAHVPPVVDAALEAGINLFDTADSYLDSEERLGRALGRRRDEVVIATKFGSSVDGGRGGAAPIYIRKAVERSLDRLGTDRIDLYQLHRPDPDVPIPETLAVLDELVREGKVLEIGCSNFSATQLREAEAVASAGTTRFVSVQNRYNLLQREDELEALPECRTLGLSYLPFFPLASGLLTGKYQRGAAAPVGTRFSAWGERLGAMLNDATFDVVEALTDWAEAHGHSLLDLAFAWLIAEPVVASVIAGATKAEQVRANAAAAAWELTPAEVAEVNEIAPEPESPLG